MNSTLNKQLLPKFGSIIDNDEEILWTGQPKFFPFILTGLAQGILPVAFGIIWLVGSLNLKPENDFSVFKYIWLMGLIPLLIGIYVFLNRILSFSNTAYCYSNKRVMMRTGFIGTDFKTIDYDKISDIEVTVNVIERIFNVGSVRFFCGEVQSTKNNTTNIYDNWSSIENQYEIFKMVKQTSVGFKTDLNYPNALRPESNPGYNTKYDNK